MIRSRVYLKERHTNLIRDLLLCWVTLLLCYTGGCRNNVYAPPLPVTKQLSSPSCSPLKWKAIPGLGDKALLLVPVRIEGVQHWFQLDSGLDVTHIARNLVDKHRSWRTRNEGKYVSMLLSGTIAQWNFRDHRVLVSKDFDDQTGVSGAIGLDLLLGKMILLDFCEQVAICNGETIAKSRLPKTWLQGELRNNKVFFTFRFGDLVVNDIFIDTGASLFDIVVDLDLWRKLTRRKLDDYRNETRKVPAWGKVFTAIGAPAAEPVRLGQADIGRPIVWVRKEAPDEFSKWSYKVNGLAGNRSMFDRCMFLDLRSRVPRLSIIPCNGTPTVGKAQ